MLLKLHLDLPIVQKVTRNTKIKLEKILHKNQQLNYMASTVPNPHGTFFRACLSKPGVAKDLLKAHLAPDMVERINWDSLEPTDKSYVEDTLAHAHTDVIYKCFLKNQDQDTYLYMLLDNNRTPKDVLASRMSKYNLALTAQHLSEGHTYMPLILNVCIAM